MIRVNTTAYASPALALRMARALEGACKSAPLDSLITSGAAHAHGVGIDLSEATPPPLRPLESLLLSTIEKADKCDLATRWHSLDSGHDAASGHKAWPRGHVQQL